MRPTSLVSINLYAKPNSPVLGKRFGAAFKDIKSKIEALDHQAVKTFLDAETLTINNETLGVADMVIFRLKLAREQIPSLIESCRLNYEQTAPEAH